MTLTTYNPYYIAAILALSGLHLGMETSSLTSFLSSSQFRRHFGPLSVFEQSILACSNAMGAVVGGFLFGAVGDKIGCLWTLRFSCFPWAVGSVVACLLSNVYLVILARVFKGFSIGTFSSTIPIYINSALPAKKRGFALSVVQLCAALGTLFIYYIGYLFETSIKTSWAFRVTWSLEAIPTVFLCALSWLLPESPHWYATKQKWVDAAETIDRISTGGTKEASEERKILGDKFFVLSSCTTDGVANNESYGKLFLKKYCKYTLVGISTQIMLQLTGITTLMYFFAFTCEVCGLTDSNKTWFVSMQYVVMSSFNLFPMLFMDSCRRKDAMIYGYLLLSFTFFAMWLVAFRCSFNATSLSANSPFDWELTGFAASLMLALYLFMVSVYSSLVQGFSWLYVGEIFPSNVKMKGTSICMAVSWSLNLSITLVSPSMIRISRYWIYIVFSALCMCSTITLIAFPETKAENYTTSVVKHISPPQIKDQDNLVEEATGEVESEVIEVEKLERPMQRKFSFVGPILKRKVTSISHRIKNKTTTANPFPESTSPLQLAESPEVLQESPDSLQELPVSFPQTRSKFKQEKQPSEVVNYLGTAETFGSHDDSSFYSDDWNSGLLPNTSAKLVKRAISKVQTSPPVNTNQDTVWWNRDAIESMSPALEKDHEIVVPRKRFGANKNTMTTNLM